MRYKLYEVGGKIRDELLGLKSKDVDYSVIIEDYTNSIDMAFCDFCKQITSEGYEIFLETPDCFTVRAKFPKEHKYSGVADFVLARKELYYPECGRRPVSKLGTLKDDLLRRDFKMNSIAKDIDGNFIDPFGGMQDIGDGVINTNCNSVISFNSDPLRILRALRFSITKGLEISDEIWNAILRFQAKKMEAVSSERIREELYKCFRQNTKLTIRYLVLIKEKNPGLYNSFFKNDLWLEPTFKK